MTWEGALPGIEPLCRGGGHRSALVDFTRVWCEDGGVCDGMALRLPPSLAGLRAWHLCSQSQITSIFLMARMAI